MVPAFGFSGCTSWMNWLRRPRLNRAVHKVGVLTVFRRSRVSGFSIGLSFSEDHRLGHRGAEIGLQEVEVAALVRLLDVLGEHPAIAALIAGRLLGQGGAAGGEF